MAQKLENLLLQKSELPIFSYEKGAVFTVPIHWGLVSKDIKLDPELAGRMFPEAARQWHNDLTEYLQFLETTNENLYDKANIKWFRDVFLSQGSEVTLSKEGIQSIGLNGIWSDRVVVLDNGFVGNMMINRNAGGSLYFNEDCKPEYLQRRLVKFTPEKMRAYHVAKYKGEDMEFMEPINVGCSFIYKSHNIDNYPGALFLRNWAVLYLNEALKELDSKSLL